MPTTILPKTDNSLSSELLKGGVQKTLEQTGKLPPVSIAVTPIDSSPSIYLDRFLTYNFSSSILIPVDTFSFTFAAPDDKPFYERVKEGDIVSLYGNNVPLSTGIIDTVDIETDNQYGERVMIQGRDLLSQLEDQSAVNDKQEPIWGNNETIDSAVKKLISDTRINGFRKQGVSDKPSLFATEPGESKLAALQRFLEPLNSLAFLDPNGRLVIGRPNMKQSPKSTFYLQREKRSSNVVSMKVIYSASNIANIIVPIWSGQESVQNRVAKEGVFINRAQGPFRLQKLGHRVPKAIVVSTPQGSSPEALATVERFKAGGANILQSYAKREAARQNQKEVIVQVVVPGHYNDLGEPYLVDTTYHLSYDRGSIEETMYLFQVEYSGGEGQGQRTSLFFCRLGTIVAGVEAP